MNVNFLFKGNYLSFSKHFLSAYYVLSLFWLLETLE